MTSAKKYSIDLANVETHNKVPLVCNKCYREFVRKDHFDRHINCCDDVLPSFLSYDEFASPSDEQTDNVPSMSDQKVDDHEAVRRENDLSSMSDQAVPELFYDNIESDEEVDNIDVPVLPVTIDSPIAKARMRLRKMRILDSIVQILRERVNMTLLNAARNSQTDKVNSKKELIEIVSDAFTKHLLNLREHDSEFVVLLKDTFRGKLHNKDFFAWLSKKLGFKFPRYLKRKTMLWKRMSIRKREAPSVCPWKVNNIFMVCG